MAFIADGRFDLRLISEFDDSDRGLSVVEWFENIELVCDLCSVRILCILPLPQIVAWIETNLWMFTWQTSVGKETRWRNTCHSHLQKSTQRKRSAPSCRICDQGKVWWTRVSYPYLTHSCHTTSIDLVYAYAQLLKRCCVKSSSWIKNSPNAVSRDRQLLLHNFIQCRKFTCDNWAFAKRIRTKYGTRLNPFYGSGDRLPINFIMLHNALLITGRNQLECHLSEEATFSVTIPVKWSKINISCYIVICPRMMTRFRLTLFEIDVRPNLSKVIKLIK